MEEEGSVSIFQTVSDLRRQRNYLVQSVKQYQFVYGAIMEFSQFGDTEMDGSGVKEHWVQMAQEKDGLQNEFTRLANVVDDRKVDYRAYCRTIQYIMSNTFRLYL